MTIRLDPKTRKGVLILRNLDKLTKSGIEHALFISANKTRRTISKAILDKASKTGRVYFITGPSGRRRRHRASSPGQTHANITGKTRRSIGWKITSSEMEFGYGVQTRSPTSEWAKFLEFGTKKMKPRPSLQNGLKAERGNFQSNFDAEIGKRLEGKGGFVL